MNHELFDVRWNMAAGAEEIGTFLQRMVDSDTVGKKIEKGQKPFFSEIWHLAETDISTEIITQADKYYLEENNIALEIIDEAIQQKEHYVVITEKQLNRICEVLEVQRQTVGERAYAQAVLLLCECNPSLAFFEGRLVIKKDRVNCIGYSYRE